jgi:hypothetical protein
MFCHGVLSERQLVFTKIRILGQSSHSAGYSWGWAKEFVGILAINFYLCNTHFLKRPMAKKKEKPEKQLPKVHKELEGFDIEINSFGEIKTTLDVGKINAFLNKHMDDKKLRGREDLSNLDESTTDEN